MKFLTHTYAIAFTFIVAGLITALCGTAVQPTDGAAITSPVKAPSTTMPGQKASVGQHFHSQFSREGGVPRLYQTSLPENMSSVTVKKRKQRFVGILLPLVLKANEQIAHERARLLSLIQKPQPQYADITALKSIASQYGLDVQDGTPLSESDIQELLIRVDTIPPSLALAQGAIESGWGTSRFARLGNALYGEWVWGEKAKGIVPKKRAEGKSHRIRAFEALQGSVTSYIRNLNTHPAYKELREHRANLRANGERVTGTRLVYTLLAYSTRREAYVDDLKSIIRRNGFEMLDGLNLLAPVTTQTTP